MTKIIFIYLITINFIAYSLFHLDKDYAIKGKRRISEKNLLLSCALGGTFGAWLGMNHYRHKTKKMPFKVWFYVIAISQLIFIIYFVRK